MYLFILQKCVVYLLWAGPESGVWNRDKPDMVPFPTALSAVGEGSYVVSSEQQKREDRPGECMGASQGSGHLTGSERVTEDEGPWTEALRCEERWLSGGPSWKHWDAGGGGVVLTTLGSLSHSTPAQTCLSYGTAPQHCSQTPWHGPQSCISSSSCHHHTTRLHWCSRTIVLREVSTLR
jgi:hypothetical protein